MCRFAVGFCLISMLLLSGCQPGLCENGIYRSEADLIPIDPEMYGTWELIFPDELLQAVREEFPEADFDALDPVRITVSKHGSSDRIGRVKLSVSLPANEHTGSKASPAQYGCELRLVSVGERRFGDATANARSSSSLHGCYRIERDGEDGWQVSEFAWSKFVMEEPQLAVVKRRIGGDVSGIPVPLPRFVATESAVPASTETLRGTLEKHSHEEEGWSPVFKLTRIK